MAIPLPMVLLVHLLLASPYRPNPGFRDADQGLTFDRERVEIRVTATKNGYRVRVNGFYELRNPGGAKIQHGVFYPFPLAEGMEYPDTIRVVIPSEGSGEIPIAFVRNRAGIAFPITLEPRETTAFRVEYTQSTKVSRAMYITTTTAVWGRPLEAAEFVIQLPARYRLKRLSYPPDRVERRGETIVYTIRKLDFMPVEDLEVEWVIPTDDPWK